MEDLPLQGSIAEIYFPRLIARLHRDGFEGAVRVSLGPTTKVVYFKHGEIASAASNAESDRLASLLIQAERLTQAQLDMAKSRVPPGGSLGKMLIEMGFLTPAELLQGARQQVREILGSCFSLSSGHYQVEPGALPREVTSLGLATKRLIFDSLLLSRDRQTIVREMGSMESVYRPTSDLLPGLNTLKLDVEIDRIARTVDGLLTLRDLSGRTSLDDFTVSKVVLAIELLGMVERLEETPRVEAPVRSGRAIPIESEEPPETVAETGMETGLGPISAYGGEEGGIPLAAAESARPFDPAPAPEEGEPFAAVQTSPPPSVLPIGDEAAAEPAGTVGVTPIEESSEPPPIAKDDLPPFAFQPGDEPRWEIDSKTGERVHVGPIEMTFDGTVSTGSHRRRHLVRLLALSGGVAFVLAASFLYLYLRRGASRSTSPSMPALASVPTAGSSPVEAPETAAAAEPTEDNASARPSETPSAEPQSAPAPPLAQGPEPTVGQQPAPVAAPTVSAPLVASPPPGASQPAPPPVTGKPEPPPRARPGPPPHGSVSPFHEASRYAAGLRAFDAGDAPRAAQIFGELAASEGEGRFTLQLMIACEVDSLKTARAQSGERGSLYFVPYSLKGRDCYRTLWGSYESKEAAAAAAADLPGALTSGIKPIVISMARLRPPG
ncbi:MAG TPA: DUF4388 domain-containing protein [Candidatus Polarisedimenticolia bacterium]|nr:DUF4388 domain-containing protein [Candidatus Polarisedimenticolia bacterium]